MARHARTVRHPALRGRLVLVGSSVGAVACGLAAAAGGLGVPYLFGGLTLLLAALALATSRPVLRRAMWPLDVLGLLCLLAAGGFTLLTWQGILSVRTGDSDSRLMGSSLAAFAMTMVGLWLLGSGLVDRLRRTRHGGGVDERLVDPNEPRSGESDTGRVSGPCSPRGGGDR